MLFLSCASVAGLYYRVRARAAHLATVSGTRSGIESRVRLECEREQQERLLLSVIPAYIAAEVSILCKVVSFQRIYRDGKHGEYILFVSNPYRSLAH